MKTRLLFYCFLIFSFVGCNEDTPPGLSLFAKGFLGDMVDIMEQNSINKKTIDWQDFRTRVFAKGGNAETLKQIYPAVTEALTLLGDNHSVFRSPDGTAIAVHTIPCNIQFIVKPTLPYNIGYVKVNHFAGASHEAAAVAFANEIQDQIKSQDHADIIGWIVDVRSNLGGNMWPMLAGIGPILGEGIAGYFIDPDETQYSWGYLNGTAVHESTVVAQATDPYELIVPNPKVAVLLDNGIASSGEVVAISFVGRGNAKSFGAPTCGLSTANQGFTLSSGCTLVLTSAYLADRNKKKYGVPVVPDKISTNETIIRDAVEWIKE
jgi:carboxyl-terminal processing protease